MLAAATAAVHIYLGVITHVMVATQPDATAAAGLVGLLDNLAGRVPLDAFLTPRAWSGITSDDAEGSAGARRRTP